MATISTPKNPYNLDQIQSVGLVEGHAYSILKLIQF